MSLFQNRKIFEAASPASTEKAGSPARVSEFASPAPSDRGTGIHEVHRALRNFQILLNTRRLYHHSHPKNLESLESTHDSLQQLVQKMGGLEIRVEREALVVARRGQGLFKQRVMQVENRCRLGAGRTSSLEQAAQTGNDNHRWDSFTLNTPNCQSSLPGAEKPGETADGFLPR